MKAKTIFLLTFLCCIFTFANAKTDRIICYYGSWANYRNGNGKYTAEDIDPHLCTHLIYTFLGIEPDGSLKILDPWLELDLKNIQRFNALKIRNPKLKTLIAVGGWNEGSVKYSVVAADPIKRANLIRSAVNVLQTHSFDGFDLDWEYPAQRGGASSDKQNFATLLKEFRAEFDKRGWILTAAVAAAPYAVDISYDVPALSKYLDSINVMSYDLHGAYDGVTGANAPLYPSSIDVSASAKALTVDASIRGWISRGADPQKISMGLPLYGRSFTLSNPSLKQYGAPANNGGVPGPYTQETGMMGYLEICELQRRGGWTEVWDNNTKTPYTYNGNQWIGYDSIESISLKVEYAKRLNLGGVMLWSLETADHKGVCGNRYPVLNTIKKILDDNPVDPVEPIRPSEPTSDNPDKKPDDQTEEPEPEPEEPTPYYPDEKPDDDQPKPEPDASEAIEDSSEEEDSTPTEDSGNKQTVCKKAGIERDPTDCAAFYFCVPNGHKIQPIRLACAGGLVFDSTVTACNYKELVNCDI